MKFYANESDYEDALIEAARNTCDNCGEIVSDLFRVHESATPYIACSECYAEVDAILEREAAGDMQPSDAGVLAALRRKPAGRELESELERIDASMVSAYGRGLDAIEREFIRANMAGELGPNAAEVA